MKASDILSRAVRSLRISAQAMERSIAVIEAANLKDPDAPQKLYREWVNDLIVFVGRPPFQHAAKDPDADYLSWLDSRLNNPYHVTYRAHDMVRAQHGEEVALLFAEVRWPQEVAWAGRMRGSDNDRIVFLAEMWLKAARRDPAKLFRGLVDTYAEDAVFDPGYRDAAFHMLSSVEIRDGAVDDRHWRPLWLRFAEHEFGRLLNSMPRGKLTLLAQQVREAEWQERVARSRALQAERLRCWRPALMVGVLSAALERGLSSDDVVTAEKRFIEDVASGAIDLSAVPQPPWRVFLKRLDQWAEAAPSPSAAECTSRIERVQNLPPTWTDALPEDFQRLGASDQSRLFAWFDAIMQHRSRVPPEDAAVDYGMFLIDTVGGDDATGLRAIVER